MDTRANEVIVDELAEEPILLTHRYVEGPFPYLPGKKLFKAFVKAEARYEKLLAAGRKVTAARLLKKAESMARRFKKSTGLALA